MSNYIKETLNGRNDWTLHEQLGFAVSCMFHNHNYSLYPVLSIQYWTEYAIQLGHIHFLFDGKNEPLAYITWAYLDSDTEQRLENDPAFYLHPSEWNEGGRTWILDFCCKPGYGGEVIKHLRKSKPWGTDNARWRSRRKKIMKFT